MDKYKYSLDKVLLYLDGKISPEEKTEFSLYLKENGQFCAYVMELTKIKSRDFLNNKIILFKKGMDIVSKTNGDISFLDQRMLSFRGEESSDLYRYSFRNFEISIVRSMNKAWSLFVEKPINSEITILDENANFVEVQESDPHKLLFELKEHNSYRLFHNGDKIEFVCITIL